VPAIASTEPGTSRNRRRSYVWRFPNYRPMHLC